MSKLNQDTKPKLKDIIKFLKPYAEVEKRWYEIGLELEIGDEDGIFLDEIKGKFVNDRDCFLDMMKAWVRSESTQSVTWKVLRECLGELGLQEAVDVLDSKIDFVCPSGKCDEVADSSPSQPSQQCSMSPAVTHSLAIQTPAGASQEPMCSDSPTEASCPQKSFEGVPHPPSSITMTTSSSVDYPSSMECEASTSCEPMPPGYELQLKPRSYQHELAKPGIDGKNYIIVAPTGSGKTLIAAMIITEHLKKLQASDDFAKVVFLVNTKPLADQQCTALQKYIRGARVECIVGDSIGTIQNALTQNDIVVCTTGKFLDELNQNMVSLRTESDKARISLLVMDECHHARKASSQAKVMHRYIEHKHEDVPKLPQVVGLTASPGAGENPNLDITKTIDHLVNLCALLDATHGIVTVRQNVSELEQHVKTPVLNTASVRTRNKGEIFVQLIEKEMDTLETLSKLDKPPFPKWSQQYEQVVFQKLQPLELSTNVEFRDRISTLKLLVCYSRALNVYMDLRQKDSLEVLRDYNDLPERDDTLTEREQQLKLSLNALKSDLKALTPVENPLLVTAKAIINEQFQKDPKSRGIFFVHTKRHTKAICEWLEISDDIFKPRIITGHSKDSGMTQADQEVAMENFRNGNCNILVATSVAEEGLDVPACNFVIRFQHVTNEIASTQTQGRARAAESEVTTILSSDSPMNMKEIQNSERLDLVNKIVQNNWIPTENFFSEKLKKQQTVIIRNIELKRLLEGRKCRSGEGKNVTLRCRKCKEVACLGSDIFTIGDTSQHHVVPGDDIRKKLFKKPHHKPCALFPSVIKTHKIYCKNCDADWGIMCNWPVEGHEFPVLKCVKFSFKVSGSIPKAVAQWSKAPFEVLPLEVWISENLKQ